MVRKENLKFSLFIIFLINMYCGAHFHSSSNLIKSQFYKFNAEHFIIRINVENLRKEILFKSQNQNFIKDNYQSETLFIQQNNFNDNYNISFINQLKNKIKKDKTEKVNIKKKFFEDENKFIQKSKSSIIFSTVKEENGNIYSQHLYTKYKAKQPIQNKNNLLKKKPLIFKKKLDKCQNEFIKNNTKSKKIFEECGKKNGTSTIYSKHLQLQYLKKRAQRNKNKKI